MTNETPLRPIGPDPIGRRLDHPASEPLRAELLALGAKKAVAILHPGNDAEAANFAESIRQFLAEHRRKATVQAVRLDPSFRGIRLHDGKTVQIVIGHR